MIKKIKENLIFENKYYTFFNDEVCFNNKTFGTHVKLQPTKKQDLIAVLPVLKNGNILLIKNYRYAVDDFLFQIVKGGNGTEFLTDKIALQCVLEELEEEMNKKSNDIRFIGNFYESPSLLAAKGYSFIAFNCVEVLDKKHFQEDSECIEAIIEVEFDKIDEFMSDKKSCSTTLLLISQYQKFRLENKNLFS